MTEDLEQPAEAEPLKRSEANLTEVDLLKVEDKASVELERDSVHQSVMFSRHKSVRFTDEASIV